MQTLKTAVVPFEWATLLLGLPTSVFSNSHTKSESKTYAIKWHMLKSWLLIPMASQQKQALNNNNKVLLIAFNLHTFSSTHLPQCQINLAVCIFLNKKSLLSFQQQIQDPKNISELLCYLCYNYLHIYKLTLKRSTVLASSKLRDFNLRERLLQWCNSYGKIATETRRGKAAL